MASRRRIQRAIRGDRVLQPMDIDDALGQALLRLAITPETSKPYAATDMYEYYFVLPDGKVAVLTNHRIMLMFATEFAEISASIKAGNTVSIDCMHPGACSTSNFLPSKQVHSFFCGCIALICITSFASSCYAREFVKDQNVPSRFKLMLATSNAVQSTKHGCLADLLFICIVLQ